MARSAGTVLADRRLERVVNQSNQFSRSFRNNLYKAKIPLAGAGREATAGLPGTTCRRRLLERAQESKTLYHLPG